MNHLFMVSGVLPWLQSRISELALFADDMLFEQEKVCLLFLYEFSFVRLFVLMSLFPFLMDLGSIFYGLAPL